MLRLRKRRPPRTHSIWRRPAWVIFQKETEIARQEPRKVSLNRFGQIVETSLHQSLHGFYRSHPVCSPEAKAQGFCDDLVPVETSPLNKYFWKIHGLIDGLVGDWLKANGYREIAADCGDRAGFYTWRGRWTGKYPFL